MILHHSSWFVILAVVVCLAQDLSSGSSYCRLSAQHTMCRYQSLGPDCSGSVSVRGVEDRNRQIILQTHNSLRSILATGQETRGQPGPQPQASNMQIMTWDEELATVAQRLAEQCVFKHDCNDCRKVGRFPVGQNLALEWTTGPPMSPSWKKMITKWYDEVEEFPNTSARKYEFSVITGHYSQVIWADTNRVGCGFTSYLQNGTVATNLYVCNYGPSGNFIGLPSYKVGPPCSQCPSNTVCSTRFSGLCEPVKRPAETSSESLPETNEIIRPVSTAKPTRLPTKVTTSIMVTQRPTVLATPMAIMQRPTKPITTAQSLTKLAASRPAFVTTTHNSSNTERRDFVCQIGKGQCQASFRGSPWTFRAPPILLKSSYLETNVRSGELTELQINFNFPPPKASGLVCIEIQMKQEGDIEGGKRISAPLLIKIQPEKSQFVVVPIHSGEEGKWVQLKLTVSRIRAPYKLTFQQNGPAQADEGALSSKGNLRLALGEMRISSGSCKL